MFENKYWQLIMSPFSFLYKWVMQFRNHLYNIGHKPQFEFETKIVSVGNLSMGGTGKTPVVEYLIRYFIEMGYGHQLSTLSRGYGRKTKGFRVANLSDDATTLGDEAFQMYQKFNENIQVTVGEDRVLAIPSIIYEFPENEIILLDDAYQHRSVKPNVSILLTEFNRPFYKDFVVPSGRLRESRKGAQRANIVLVTKCPENVSAKVQEAIQNEIRTYTDAPVFFTVVAYDNLKAVKEGTNEVFSDVVIMSGIAHSDQFESYLSGKYNVKKHFEFPDHHQYNSKEIYEVFEFAIKNQCKVITTEKDWARLKSHKGMKKEYFNVLHYLPIMVQFLDEEESFQQLLEESLKLSQ